MTFVPQRKTTLQIFLILQRLCKVIEQSSLHRPKLRTERRSKSFSNLISILMVTSYQSHKWRVSSRPALQNGSTLVAFALLMYLFTAPCGAYQDFNLGIIDDLSGFPLVGAAVGDWTGCSVASAGDVNGDGIVDIIIGAYLATPAITPARSQAGVSYVYFGRPDVSGIPNFDSVDLGAFTTGIGTGFRIWGAVASDQSGRSVGYAGDLNNDGKDDIFVGAPQASPPPIDGTSRGSAGITFIIFGRNVAGGLDPAFSDIYLSSIGSSSNGFLILGPSFAAGTGFAVSRAGDVNGDGVSDIIVGAHLITANVNASTTRTSAGVSYVVYGTPFAGTVDLSTFGSIGDGFRIFGASAGDWSGYSLTGGGDVNGDGVDDVIVAATRANSLAGVSYVVFGRDVVASGTPIGKVDLATFGAPNSVGFRIVGAVGGDNSGVSVKIAGDVNGDGVCDVVIGANLADPPVLNGVSRDNAGVVYVVFGRNMSVIDALNGVRPGNSAFGDVYLSSFTTGSSIGFRIVGALTGDMSGVSVSCAGDVNGDGIGDLVIGAPQADPPALTGNSNAGITYVVFGRHSDYTNIDLHDVQTGYGLGYRILGTVSNGRSGCSVSSGDVNNDGYSDLIIGAQQVATGAGGNVGAGYVVYGAVTSPTSQPSAQPSVQPSRQPSSQPSQRPVAAPSSQPSALPTSTPTTQPTCVPTSQPSGQPTTLPTAQPSTQPSCTPSTQPSARPSSQSSTRPSAQPTQQPLAEPTTHPSSQPTTVPSGQPSTLPTSQPTRQPSSMPTAQPSCWPSAHPSSQPSVSPSSQPSARPSSQPTASPSTQPSTRPSAQPSGGPSAQPSTYPSAQPSSQPSTAPSSQPSVSPSVQPSSQPSSSPSVQPSAVPSLQPSTQPTQNPTSVPSSAPTGQPSTSPSALPSSQPTICPSAQPSASPSNQPSGTPSAQPSTQPSSQPTGQPSINPSTQPTAQPTSVPSVLPSIQPSASPTFTPTVAWIAHIHQLSCLHTATYADYVWVCGIGNVSGDKALCVLVNGHSGEETRVFKFELNRIVSILNTSTPNEIVLAAHTDTESVYTRCTSITTTNNLSCTMKSFRDATFIAASFVPYPNKIVFVGWCNIHTSIVILNVATNIAKSYMYTAHNMKTLALTQVQSPPNFVGSFVTGSCISKVGMNIVSIVVGLLRTDNGILSGMSLTPVSGGIVSSEGLVNAMVVEYVGPDCFIAGGLQLRDSNDVTSSVRGYVLRVNALYNTVQFCMRYVSVGSGSGSGSGGGDGSGGGSSGSSSGGSSSGSSTSSVDSRRRLGHANVANSMVKGMVRVQDILYVISDTTIENKNTTLLSLLKVHAATGDVMHQAHISAQNCDNVICNDITNNELYLYIVCNIHHNITHTQPVHLRVNLNLVFSTLPVTLIYTNITLHAENVPFKRTIMSITTTATSMTTRDSTSSIGNSGPTHLPTVHPTLRPTTLPTLPPSIQPSSSPTTTPTTSPQPTSTPSTSGPTNTYKPTVLPTLVPTHIPTLPPTALPTLPPTIAPTTLPTTHPTPLPTLPPTLVPTTISTTIVTRIPTTKSTNKPQSHPTTTATVLPTPTPSITTSDTRNKQSIPSYTIGVSVGGGLCLLLLGFIWYRYEQHKTEEKDRKRRWEEYCAQQAAIAAEERLASETARKAKKAHKKQQKVVGAHACGTPAHSEVGCDDSCGGSESSGEDINSSDQCSTSSIGSSTRSSIISNSHSDNSHSSNTINDYDCSLSDQNFDSSNSDNSVGDSTLSSEIDNIIDSLLGRSQDSSNFSYSDDVV